MKDNQESQAKQRFLFNVDILIEGETNGRALETLLHLLNSNQIQDYNIRSGIELGKWIQVAIKEARKNVTKESAAKTQEKVQQPNVEPTKKKSADHEYLYQQLEKFRENNMLIRVTVLKGKGIKLSLPCRILNFDPAAETVTVYHVDEKKVYLFRINEIDDVEVS
ncbi:hypothetical protein [Paenibacillus thalictri]|uniref:Uncharacterized protein n=1 Tax=Paenibacillus thalictri TaxID=2527873 RepID=A0A4Q9DNL3_9BACL|nr:hypothetical protein [Paenibacillus thalictri]TBL75135.1 hypothetical protein EYB31_24325 [Paenibacillus thalictri]